jgi:hypothetical protein
LLLDPSITRTWFLPCSEKGLPKPLIDELQSLDEYRVPAGVRKVAAGPFSPKWCHFEWHLQLGLNEFLNTCEVFATCARRRTSDGGHMSHRYDRNVVKLPAAMRRARVRRLEPAQPHLCLPLLLHTCLQCPPPNPMPPHPMPPHPMSPRPGQYHLARHRLARYRLARCRLRPDAA